MLVGCCDYLINHFNGPQLIKESGEIDFGEFALGFINRYESKCNLFIVIKLLNVIKLLSKPVYRNSSFTWSVKLRDGVSKSFKLFEGIWQLQERTLNILIKWNSCIGIHKFLLKLLDHGRVFHGVWKRNSLLRRRYRCRRRIVNLIQLGEEVLSKKVILTLT